MGDIKVGNGSISILSLIAMVGALLAFIGFFLAITKFSYGPFESDTINGIDLLKEKMGDADAEYKFWKVMPLLTMIMGIATIVLGILPMFGVNNSGVKIAFMVCGIITFVFGLLTFICTAGTPVLDTKYASDYKAHRQIGAYFALIGGLIAGGCATADKFVKL